MNEMRVCSVIFIQVGGLDVATPEGARAFANVDDYFRF